ncbi:MAG: hypothetical protein ABR533_09035 [Desulfonatronovibrio sp.]
MFTDPKYGTTTLPAVAQEFIKTTKFKTKYPWRSSYTKHIKTEPTSKVECPECKEIFVLIKNILESGVINSKNDKLFDLSFVDQQIVSFAIAHESSISTGDQGIIDFAMQEFSEDFQGNLHPLELINKWLRHGLLEWCDAKHRILEEWTITGERPQPQDAKEEFKGLTGKEYPGP